jgi:hypothetical protein
VVLEVDSAYQLNYDLAIPSGDGYINIDQLGPMLLAGPPTTVRAALPESRLQAYLIRVGPLLWHYAPDHVGAIAASPARVLQPTLTIDGKPFAAEVLAWTGQHPCASC